MRPRRKMALTRAIALVIPVAVLSLGAAGPANADTSRRGPAGQTLTVTKSTGVSRSGETVTVSGTGFNVDKGIYVAFCVDNGAGQLPSPCGGGADTSGSLGASHWISSNPPSYAEGLTVPYGPGGTFRVQLTLTTTINNTVDCTVRTCAVVTRNDHTRTADRSQDVRIPISFAAAPPAAKPSTAAPRPGGAGTSGGGAPENAAPPPAPGAPATTAPGPTTAAPGSPGTDPATGVGATTAGPGLLQVTRVSTAQSADGWWTGALIALGAVALLLFGLRLRRRRGARP